MTELKATLILTAVAVALTPFGAWLIGRAKRSRHLMAPLAGLMMAMGAFYPPPPPPPTEAAEVQWDEADGSNDPEE